MNLPDIHDVARLRLNPGDILVLSNAEVEISQDQANGMKARIREVTGRPDLPVVVLGRDWSLSVVEGPV